MKINKICTNPYKKIYDTKTTRKSLNLYSNQTTFKGQRYSFGYFTDEEIVDTYKYMKYSDEEWKDIAKNDFINKYSFFKYVFGGGAEKVEKHLNEMEKLRKGLKEQERLDEIKRKELLEINKEQEKKNEILNTAKAEFQNNYITLINLEKTENATQIPNGILIEKTDREKVENFINWTKTSSLYITKEIQYPKEVSFNQINTSQKTFLKNFNEILKKAKDNYENKNLYTLLYISNFELLGEDCPANKQIIATFKSLMSCCAEKYKCTLLINIPKYKLAKIDPILLVDSRIQLRIKL
ncbi:hypothetical protein J6R97_06950 [bacterium]|nr:hypothetical protein [bacterium]